MHWMDAVKKSPVGLAFRVISVFGAGKRMITMMGNGKAIWIRKGEPEEVPGQFVEGFDDWTPCGNLVDEAVESPANHFNHDKLKRQEARKQQRGVDILIGRLISDRSHITYITGKLEAIKRTYSPQFFPTVASRLRETGLDIQDAIDQLKRITQYEEIRDTHLPKPPHFAKHMKIDTWDAADILRNHEILMKQKEQDAAQRSHAVVYEEDQREQTEQHDGPAEGCGRCDSLRKMYGPPPNLPKKVDGRALTIGRIVRYVMPERAERYGHRIVPAIVIDPRKSPPSDPGRVVLHVFTLEEDGGRVRLVDYDAGKKPGTWHWPPKES